MGTIVDFQKYYDEQEEIQKQKDFLKEHYRRFILEFLEMPPNNAIQIMRSNLDLISYRVMIDWYFPDDIQRDLLRVEFNDEAPDIQIKKDILRRYQMDSSYLEQTTVKNVIAEIQFMLKKLSKE